MKQSKAYEVTLRAALEMKYMCSCSHILRAEIMLSVASVSVCVSGETVPLIHTETCRTCPQ